MILNLYIFLKFSDTSEINNFTVHFWESENYMQNSRSSEWKCIDFGEKAGSSASAPSLISRPKTFLNYNYHTSIFYTPHIYFVEIKYKILKKVTPYSSRTRSKAIQTIINLTTMFYLISMNFLTK